MRPLALFAYVILSAGLTGCYVNLTDKTPPEFPMDIKRDQPGPSTKPVADWYWSGSAKHRFKLMVGTGQFVRNVTAYITVDGHEYPMTAAPSYLFYYDATNTCQAGYNYSFRVTSSALWTDQTTMLPIDGTTKRVNVSKFGNVVWIPHLGGAHTDAQGSLRFMADTDLVSQVVTIRNLTPYPFDIYTTSLVSMVGATDNNQFSVSTFVPGSSTVQTPSATNPIRLNCGEEMGVLVKWVGACPICSANGALGVSGVLRDPSNTGWILTLLLQGVQEPG